MTKCYGFAYIWHKSDEVDDRKDINILLSVLDKESVDLKVLVQSSIKLRNTAFHCIAVIRDNIQHLSVEEDEDDDEDGDGGVEQDRVQRVPAYLGPVCPASSTTISGGSTPSSPPRYGCGPLSSMMI